MNNKELFAKNLEYYMERSGKTRYEICDALDINYNTMSSWMQGRKMPRIDKVQALADYFGILKSDLIEEHDFNEKQNKNDDLVQIVARLRNDNDFFSLVSAIYKLNVKQFNSIKELISAFINK